MFVKDVMIKDPMTAQEKTTVFEALELMRKHHISRLLIVRDSRLIGIVTELDLMRVSPSTATSLSVFELHYILSKMAVKDVMTKDVITVSPDATIEQAAVLMRDKEIGGLPVVEGGMLVGIVTETNLFDAMLEHYGARLGGVRITVAAKDQPGQLASIADVIRDLGGNVKSLVTHDPIDGRGKIVVKVTGVSQESLVTELTSRGLEVTHVTE